MSNEIKTATSKDYLPTPAELGPAPALLSHFSMEESFFNLGDIRLVLSYASPTRHASRLALVRFLGHVARATLAEDRTGTAAAELLAELAACIRPATMTLRVIASNLDSHHGAVASVTLAYVPPLDSDDPAVRQQQEMDRIVRALQPYGGKAAA